MLQSKRKWTKELIDEFEIYFKDYKKYTEHENLCKKK